MQTMQDVVIVGAGPAGLSLARALSQLGLSVTLVEQQAVAALADPAADGRDIALTHLSVKTLQGLGVWAHIPQSAVSTIREARVINGGSDQAMQLSTRHADPLGFIVANHVIRKACFDAVAADPNITLLDETKLTTMARDAQQVLFGLSNGTEGSTRLLIASDSRFSDTRKRIGMSATMKDFGQTMVVCQMTHDRPHNDIAHECFLYGVTLAVLPLAGNRSSVILTHSPQGAQQAFDMAPAAFEQMIATLFKNRLGEMRLDGQRFCYPLVGVYADRFVDTRFALTGDAAVGMHPVTAHGYNFGLKGQRILTELIRAAAESGGDIGAPDLLLRYQRRMRAATRPLYLATQGIVTLYTNESPPARVLRTVLLQAANRLTPIKNALMDKLVESGSHEHGPSAAHNRVAPAKKNEPA